MRHPRSPASSTQLRFALLVLLAAAVPLRAATVGEVPKPRAGGWSVDLTGQISRETLDEIDRLAASVKAHNGARLAVAVVDTTGGAPARGFATRLFNAWGIGERGKDNGVLLFAALVDHKVELILGRGLSTPARRQASAAIVREEMVPRFRAGDPGGALLAGAHAAAERLLDLPPAQAEAAPAPTAAPEPAPTPLPTELPVAPAPATALPVAPLAAAPEGGTSGLLGSGLALLVLGGLGYGGYKLSTLPRRCPKCKSPMERLAGAAAAEHFTAVERTEDRLGSVDIRIYRCPGCGELVKDRNRHFFSAYGDCPECGAIAVEKRSWTVREATYDDDGLEQIDWSCQHCSYRSSTTSAIPRLVRSDDRSSTSTATYFSADSSSSSSSSSTDSSSSSSSDLGGGSSSGDGASGSW